MLVTIQVDMHDRLALALQDDLTSRIAETGARGVLIDISALGIVDSFIGRMIANTAGMARVLDGDEGGRLLRCSIEIAARQRHFWHPWALQRRCLAIPAGIR